MSPNLVFFGVIAVLSIAAAIGVVASRNAVRSALALVLNFFGLAVLYFSLKAEMLGITQIVVYAGAIMVLFLFVIMLLHVSGAKVLAEKRDQKKLVGVIFGIVLAGLISTQALFPLVDQNFVHAPDDFGGPHAVGRTLFSAYAFPFEAISVLLLIGIVGSILLAKRRME